MNLKYSFAIIAAFIGFICNCATLKPDRYISKEPLNPRISGITVSIDELSVHQAFSDYTYRKTLLKDTRYGETIVPGGTILERYTIEDSKVREHYYYPQTMIVSGITWIGGIKINENTINDTTWYPTVATEDALRLINNESDNLFLKSDNRAGYANWHISHGESHGNGLWIFSSFLTLFMVNIIGYPMFSHTTEVNIHLDIFNADSTLIASYEGNAKRTAYSAAWWGYKWAGLDARRIKHTSYRASELKALSQALKKIRKQVMRNASSLISKLADSRRK